MDDEDAAGGGRPQRGWFLEGARQAAMGPMFIVAFSLVGVGGLARDAGFPIEIAVASTLLIWAGPAQVLFFGAVAAKMAWPAIAVSISLSSVRFLPMVVSLLPMLRTKRTSTLTLLLAAHFMAVTVWAEGMRRLPPLPKNARMAFFFGMALTCIAATMASTAAGYVLIGQLPLPLAAGLLFLTPIYFVATLTRGASKIVDRLALGLGLLLAPLTQFYAPQGFDLLLLGGGAGTAAFWMARRIETRGSLL